MTDTADPVVELTLAEGGDDLAFVKTLFVEYAETLDYQICFDAFDRELENLPAPYAPPGGALILARVDGRVAGCAALRPLGDGGQEAELCRLFVRPGFRGFSLGRRLTEAAVGKARDLGYRRVKLETVSGLMAIAESVYRRMGFRRCEPYGGRRDGVVSYELDL